MIENVHPLAIAWTLLLAVAGGAVFWLRIAAPRLRGERFASPLGAWPGSAVDFLYFLLYVFGGGFVGSVVAGLLTRVSEPTPQQLSIAGTTAAHLGMLAGVALFLSSDRNPRSTRRNMSAAAVVASGAATFLVAMPFVLATGAVWTGVLELFGIEVQRQPALDLFLEIDSLPWLALMSVTAVAIAPCSEELLFRRGLFRFMRSRTPRWAALLLPASLFAALHADLNTYAQLLVLGLVFALAYERTGHVGTPIVAHALFNLNTIVLSMAGLTE